MPTLEEAASYSPPRVPRPSPAPKARTPQHRTPPRAHALGCSPQRTPSSDFRLKSRFRDPQEDERDDAIPPEKKSPRAFRSQHSLPPTRTSSNAPVSYISWTASREGGSNWRQHFRADSSGNVAGTLSTSVAHPMAFTNPERVIAQYGVQRGAPNSEHIVDSVPGRFQTQAQNCGGRFHFAPDPSATTNSSSYGVMEPVVKGISSPPMHQRSQHTSPPMRQRSQHTSPPPRNGFAQQPLSETKIKRLLSPRNHHEVFKKAKGFDKLDLLCSATLEMGALQDNPSGCSCPKSKCIALYCDCFKAGRRCSPGQCTCLDCKNTIDESGPNGARTNAIRSILARNPRAFTTAGMGNPLLKLPPGEIACNCVRSRCLKLYCSCFRNGRACRPGVCTCVGCYNTEHDEKGHRKVAIQQALEKRPDAFQTKQREKGLGCACKNNRCIRKYCECFRNKMGCTDRCSCRNCENGKPGADVHGQSIDQDNERQMINSKTSATSTGPKVSEPADGFLASNLC